MNVSPERAIEMVGQMLLIRRFEEKAAQMYGLRKIGGFCHLYIGQEASAVGSVATLDLRTDYVVTAYRDHGHAIACGSDPRILMAELFGKATGCSRGKGGSMHFFDVRRHMLGGNGIVGAQIPFATGVAFSLKQRKEPGVVLCYFGDGAIHQGSFHESLNLARIWNLPVLYICENNQYGMGTDFRRVSSVQDFSIMGASYGIRGIQSNGMDALAVHADLSPLVQDARENGNPAFVEIRTYRYKGHSMSDPAKYRDKEELEQYRQQDPLLIMKSHALRAGILTEDQYDAMDRDARKRCEEAVQFAEQSPEPSPESIYDDIYATELQ